MTHRRNMSVSPKQSRKTYSRTLRSERQELNQGLRGREKEALVDFLHY